MDIKNAVAIVTGSATGIGAAVARKLSSKGCRVVINYSKSEAEARETVGQCREHGVETLMIQADVSVDEDCGRMVDQTMKEWGRIDILVNNAGISKLADHNDLDALSADDFLRIYKVNVIGTYQMTRAVAPHMKAQGKGSIINVSSLAGVIGVGSSIAYAASKGALNTMTICLARALAPEIRVNAVCPGLTQTRWLSEVWGEEATKAVVAHVKQSNPLKAVSTPDDVAEPIVWLIEGSDHVTGETLMIDAGMHLSFAPLVAR
jgi:3-oxoacyl-[acyl-carrier protein] reductase